MTALDTQVGGGHYKGLAIQPIEVIYLEQLPYCEGNVIKYTARWRDKNGIEDLRKCAHYLDLAAEVDPDPAPRRMQHLTTALFLQQFPEAEAGIMRAVFNGTREVAQLLLRDLIDKEAA